jgi:hypothetical protein
MLLSRFGSAVVLGPEEVVSSAIVVSTGSVTLKLGTTLVSIVLLLLGNELSMKIVVGMLMVVVNRYSVIA